MSTVQTRPTPLAGLAEDAMAILGQFLQERSYPDGATIVTAGEPGDGCLFVDQGSVRLDAPMEHLDTDVTIGYVELGEILGELSMLDQQPRSATAIADGPVQGRWLATASLAALLESHPSVGAAVLGGLGRDVAAKLRETNQRLTTFLQGSGRDLVAEEMVAAAVAAQHSLDGIPESVMDAALEDMAGTFGRASKDLAAKTVEVTHIGRADHKALKNAWAAMGVYEDMTGAVGRGVLGTEGTITRIAAPVGVVFGIIPVTNPVATAMFKVLSSLRSGNAIILSFHRMCLPLADDVGALVQEVLSRQVGAYVIIEHDCYDRQSKLGNGPDFFHIGQISHFELDGKGEKLFHVLCR